MTRTVRYHIDHQTTYRYESAVSLSRQQLHLTPRANARQSCLEHRIVIDPEPTHLHSRVDAFGNPLTQFDIESPHSRLIVRALSTVEVRSQRPPADDLRSGQRWEDAAGALAYGAKPVQREASRFLFESPYVRVKREFAAYAAPSFTAGRTLLDATLDLMRRIHGEFEFDPEATTVATPVLKILEDKRGVCQDFAHLMLACLRSRGLAARYVSGYLLTRPPPGQPRLVGADASHAWISLYCPAADGGTWIDFDPTNNLLPDTEHVTLAWGRDFGDVSPLRGVILGGDAHQPDVAVTVTPLTTKTDEGSKSK